ncbi:hypothetical protein [Engelhardtia mirabilis]|uniref:Uncharacterized protein n=1 Tax=Engelhardtia mirabilis TaxID=2528011 RepID=A0A518BFY8_9BACT|nr:hypothetical protein Pla133_09630 [Planctomycetes bacterium Pla133]QDV00223.1 hypothetical protein Pla86_09620 [Planctomycetes bacterium Pla86]
MPAATLLIPLPTSAGGLAAIHGNWSVGISPGTELWLQSWIVDPSGPQGFAASNGLLCKAP